MSIDAIIRKNRETLNRVKEKEREDLLPKAYVYARVSTSLQVENGDSIDEQIAECKKWIAKNSDYVYGGSFADAGKSGGEMTKRKNLHRMIAKLGKGDAVVVYSISRLNRGLRDYVDIKQRITHKNAKLFSVSETINDDTAEGSMVSNMHAVIAEYQLRQTRERVKVAMTARRDAGKVCGQLAYGFSAVETNVGKYVYPSRSEHETMDAILRHRADGKSWKKISNFLQERNMPPRSGGFWACSSLDRIVKRETQRRMDDPRVEDLDLISKYEAAKAPWIINYEIVCRYIDPKTGLFCHEDYNRDHDPKNNYEAHSGVYLPDTVDKIKKDVNSGALVLPTQQMELLGMHGQTTVKPPSEGAEDDSVIIKLVLDSNQSSMYHALSTRLKTLKDKEDLALKLLERV